MSAPEPSMCEVRTALLDWSSLSADDLVRTLRACDPAAARRARRLSGTALAVLGATPAPWSETVSVEAIGLHCTLAVLASIMPTSAAEVDAMLDELSGATRAVGVAVTR